jgi:DNA-binding MarR family transcriptional regulator
MRESDIARLEQELMRLTRHPSMGAFAGGWEPGSERLERSAYLLMSRIEQAGPLSIGELSEAFRLNASTVNRQTAAMMRGGLVERIPDPAGGMARKFALTAYGHDRLGQHRSWTVRGLGNILAGWEAEEIEDLVRSLARLNGSIQRRLGTVEREEADTTAGS